MTGFIAAYGAVLSTLALVWNLYKLYHDRGRLKVEAQIMRTVPDDNGKDLLVVSATNKGRRSVNVKGWAVKVGDGVRIIDTGKLPTKLQEGESFSEILDEFEHIFSQPLRSLLFFDFTGREWHIKPSLLRRLLADARRTSSPGDLAP